MNPNYSLETTKDVDPVLREILDGKIYHSTGEMQFAAKNHLGGKETIKKISVIRHEGKIVSWGVVVDWVFSERECWVYTDPKHRRKGLATKCLKSVRRGYKELYFHTCCTVAFWESLKEKYKLGIKQISI